MQTSLNLLPLLLVRPLGATIKMSLLIEFWLSSFRVWVHWSQHIRRSCLLKSAFPTHEYSSWGTGQTVAIAKELDLFDDFLVLNDRSVYGAAVSLIQNMSKILLFRPRWTFDLEIYSKLSSVLSLWTMSMNRVGFVSDTTKFRKYLQTHLIFFNRFRYVGDLYSSMFHECMPESCQQGTGR